MWDFHRGASPHCFCGLMPLLTSLHTVLPFTHIPSFTHVHAHTHTHAHTTHTYTHTHTPTPTHMHTRHTHTHPHPHTHTHTLTYYHYQNPHDDENCQSVQLLDLHNFTDTSFDTISRTITPKDRQDNSMHTPHHATHVRTRNH